MGKKKQNSSASSSSAVTQLPRQSIAYFKASKKHPHVPNEATLNTAKVLWPLSLFMKYHDNENFEAIVDLALNPKGLKPKNQEFILGDGPQAYNFAIDKFDTDPEGDELRAAADSAGDEWLIRNDRAIQKLQQKEVKFSRWREILADPDYQAKRKEIFDCFNDGSYLGQRVKNAMEQTAYAVLERFEERGEIHDKVRGRDMAVRFVLEECALFAHMALKYGYHFIAYPSDCPAAVAITKEVFVDSDLRARGKNLLQWLPVGVRHPKPQLAPIPEPTSPNEDSSLSFQDKTNAAPPLNEQGASSSNPVHEVKKVREIFGGSSSGSSSDEESPPQLPPALQKYERLLIGQINAFTQGLKESGELDEHSSELFLNSVAKNITSGSPPKEEFIPPLSPKEGKGSAQGSTLGEPS